MRTAASYCEYCDVFLTHDSPSVRRAHNDGWKHKAAVRAYYEQWAAEHPQEVLAMRIRLMSDAAPSAAQTAAVAAAPPLLPFPPAAAAGSAPQNAFLAAVQLQMQLAAERGLPMPPMPAIPGVPPFAFPVAPQPQLTQQHQH